jgi:hypothetical protein
VLALVTREPVPPLACSVSLGLWPLVAPSLWYFQSPVASHHSQAVGLVVVVLSAWALWAGPGPGLRSTPARVSDGRV